MNRPNRDVGLCRTLEHLLVHGKIGSLGRCPYPVKISWSLAKCTMAQGKTASIACLQVNIKCILPLNFSKVLSIIKYMVIKKKKSFGFYSECFFWIETVELQHLCLQRCPISMDIMFGEELAVVAMPWHCSLKKTHFA